MKRAGDFSEIYLCVDFLDFRRGKEAMIAMIEHSLKQKPSAGALFGFTNRRRDRVRFLYWDKTGYAQWSKILEDDRFLWPQTSGMSSFSLSPRELEWLLDGVDIQKIKTHESRHYPLNS